MSDLERARNYLDALKAHYGNHQTRMAERLKLSKGWLSKMLKVATIPDAVIAAFASPGDVQLKPAYTLAQALDDKDMAKAITAMARQVAKEQAARREAGAPPSPATDVLRRLLDAPKALSGDERPEPYRYATKYGRTALTVQSANRQGVTIRLHAGSGADTDELMTALRDARAHLEATGKGLQR